MGIPRSDKVIGIDGTDKLSCLCVPPGDGVRVAMLRSTNGRVAAGVVGQFPGDDVRLVNIA